MKIEDYTCRCKKHGWIDSFIVFKMNEVRRNYCMLCLTDKFEELGVERLMPISTERNKLKLVVNNERRS